MFGVYLFAAIVGAGLLVVSLLGGGDGDGDVHAGDANGAGDAGSDDTGAGHLVVALFRPRNMIFGAAAFGLTGTLLTVLRAHPIFTAAAAAGLGTTFFLLSHALFTWLRRSEVTVDPLTDTQLMGERARVTLSLEPGHPGRVACLLGGREVYLTARLGAAATEAVPAGREVVIVRVTNGVAEVLPPEVFDRQLPS
jgi:hypothetical protein